MRPRRESPLFTALVDSREQLPYSFGPPKRRELADGGTNIVALNAGDYSCELDGTMLPVRIERKTLSDFFGVVGRGRERFEREMERLCQYRAYLLIEATAAEIKAGYERSLVNSNAALGSCLHWSNVYNVHVVFAGNRRLGQELCQRILEDYAVHSLNNHNG